LEAPHVCDFIKNHCEILETFWIFTRKMSEPPVASDDDDVLLFSDYLCKFRNTMKNLFIKSTPLPAGEFAKGILHFRNHLRICELCHIFLNDEDFLSFRKMIVLRVLKLEKILGSFTGATFNETFRPLTQEEIASGAESVTIYETLQVLHLVMVPMLTTIWGIQHLLRNDLREFVLTDFHYRKIVGFESWKQPLNKQETIVNEPYRLQKLILDHPYFSTPDSANALEFLQDCENIRILRLGHYVTHIADVTCRYLPNFSELEELELGNLSSRGVSPVTEEEILSGLKNLQNIRDLTIRFVEEYDCMFRGGNFISKLPHLLNSLRRLQLSSVNLSKADMIALAEMKCLERVEIQKAVFPRDDESFPGWEGSKKTLKFVKIVESFGLPQHWNEILLLPSYQYFESEFSSADPIKFIDVRSSSYQPDASGMGIW
jgi:hypothetical protein